MRIPLLAIAVTLAASLAVMSRPVAMPPPSDLDRLLFVDPAVPWRTDVYDGAITPGLLRDKLAVMSFLSAECGILCITRTMAIDTLARSLPPELRNRVVFLAIEVSPAAADPRRLRAFAESLLGPGARLRVLPSEPEETKALLGRLSYPASALPEPPALVMLFDRRGRIAMSYGGDPLDGARLERDLGVLDTFTQGLGHSSPGGSDGARAPL